MTDGMYMCIYDYKRRYVSEYMYLYASVCMSMYV